MLIIENINNKTILLETLICREVKTFDKKPKEINVGIIDVDYSLIRYLGQATEINDININNCGYPIIKRKDNRTTTLGRFILEYYSKYDERLKEILENEDYEVNHINKNKLDNRIENLEIVTHEDNIKHSKGLEYSVIYTKEELKKLGFLFEDSKSNFVFVTHPKVSAKQLFENLKKENVYVRYFAKPERISNYLRITIGTDEEMQKLLSLLKKYC